MGNLGKLLASLHALAQQVAPTTAPTTAPATPVQKTQLALMGISVVALLLWAFRRLANPRKLLLRSAPARPNRLTGLLVLGLLLGGIALGTLGFQTVRHLLGDPPPQTPPYRQAQLATLTATQLLWLLVVLTVSWARFRHGLGNGLGLTWRHWLYDSARGVAGLLVIWPIVALLAAAGQWLFPRDLQEAHEILQLLDQPWLTAWWKALAVLLAVVVAPLYEEVLYRGVLQSALRRVLSPWPTILVASALFAALHVPYWHTMPALFALAVAMGYNYERCGRLWPSILMHMLFNALSVAFVLWGGLPRHS